jgi:protein tyrosine phosphatase (PTP) superfamily phosphohydrolase (DUF442 family)
LILAAAGIPLRGSKADAAEPLPLTVTAPVDLAGLENVLHVSEKIYSGGVPMEDAGFQSLGKLGIKTIITVDGAKPDVARAKAAGMRYVHLPFGYDGCPVPTANAIAKAVRDLPGPVYIHCHHGKHRSPVAAAMASTVLDGITGEEAINILERAGTDKNYTGLYEDVRTYRPPGKVALDRLKVEFPEIARTPELVDAMVAVEMRHDCLLKLQKDGWRSTDTHPAHEALQLQELFTELNRTGDTQMRPADYRKWMRQAEVNGKALETALRAGNMDEASAKLGRLTAGCASCHAKYRNVPQR